MKRALWVIVALAVAAALGQNRVTEVLNTPHNLSAGGPGPVVSGDNRACIFCHIPHNADTRFPYLWNQQSSEGPYTPYQSPSLDAIPGNPAGTSSRLCLSCHDGTVALGTTVGSGTIPVSGSMSPETVLGQNLGGDHPVALRPVDDGQIYPGLAQTPAVSADPAVTLPEDRVECLSCHDPHIQNNDPARGKFLVRSNEGGALCLACHDVTRPAPNHLSGWLGSAHQAAAHTRNEYYGNVGSNACLSCHSPHGATDQVLLRAVEENTCAECHAGAGTSPALLSVMNAFALPYTHPTATKSGLHQPGENAYPLNGERHAECADCHNPHAALPPGFSPTPPSLPPAMTGATGVDSLSGLTAQKPATKEHEVCFKCHGAGAGKPQATPGYAVYGRTPWRVTDDTAPDPFNTVAEFNSSVSRHNVTLPRQRTNSEVPSLRSNMLKLTGAPGRSLAGGTYIYCGDCHNNDQARNAGGTQASGVHGSNWPHILERRYETEVPPAQPGDDSPGVNYQPGLNGTYALCDKCHDIANSILMNRSFKLHKKHIQGEDTACSTCHDPHGINGGSVTNNHALINFDLAIVGPSKSGRLLYERTGMFRGRCYLTCHGENHDPERYH